jgi:steroid delta-isomerase-like uncharacterized protein
MSIENSNSLIQRIFNEAFNQGDLAIVDELVSPNHLAHNAFGGTPHGPQGLKWLIVMFRTAFPDLKCIIEDEIKVENQISAHWVMSGTHKGTFLGNPPTGHPVVVQGMIFARIENGQMAEDWILIDQLGILQQIGLVPPPIRYETREFGANQPKDIHQKPGDLS